MNEIAPYIVASNGVTLNESIKSKKYLELEHRQNHPKQNVVIKLTDFVTSAYKLNDRYKDLLLIAGYIFAADRLAYRGTDNALEYHSWARKFHFHINVSDLNFWQRPDVKQIMNEALSFMTGDHEYKFTFYQAEPYFPGNLFDNNKFKVEPKDNLKFMLFSGGLDSLAGAVESLETGPDDICLVSHQSGHPGVIGTQKRLLNALNSRYSGRCKHYKYKCSLTGVHPTYETQRTRPFLYTSMAFVLAKTYQKNEIFIYENGVTSVNFAETQDLMNGRSSRTTHPKTLRLMEKLFTIIGGSDFKIKDEYFYKTKTDVVNILKKYDHLDIFDDSVSCGTKRNLPPGSTHCGYCSQCIDRKFATYAAGIESAEVKNTYGFDFAKDDIEKDIAKKALVNYVGLAREFLNSGLTEFWLKRASEIAEIEPYLDDSSDKAKIEKLYDLFLRHAKQVETAISRMSMLYDKPLSPARPNSFYNLILKQRIENLQEFKDVKIEKGNGKGMDDGINNELQNAQRIIKKQKTKIKTLETGITKPDLMHMIDNSCRYKNGKINYSALGRLLGCTHHTAKRKCTFYQIT